MTPRNLAGMAYIAGLRLVALTDHNSCGNCPAFVAACEEHGLVPIAGMELTTAEDIHLVCLFPTLEAAMDFSATVQGHRLLIPNRPELFGQQTQYDAEDSVIGTEGYYLPAATDLHLADAAALVTDYGGLCYPAHIDREGNGLPAILGDFPESPVFAVAEVAHPKNLAQAGGRLTLCCSDAHRLWEIGNKEQTLELDVEEDADAATVRTALFLKLGGRN
ncbi:MAG: PHP domain-containing protein [Clostridiales bacterium]|nr:PHP domain-containing protein [Clostridiales bacterium]